MAAGMAAQDGAAITGPEALLIFGLSDRLLALPRRAVACVLPMAALTRPPNAPPVLEGLLLLADGALPVVSLARLLGLVEAPLTRSTALLRLRGPAARALLVDQAMAIEQPPAASLRPVAAAETFQGALVAEAATSFGTCGVLDPERLLLREEAARIESFRLLADERRAMLTGTPGEPVEGRP